jgi:hypothetical protein
VDRFALALNDGSEQSDDSRGQLGACEVPLSENDPSGHATGTSQPAVRHLILLITRSSTLPRFDSRESRMTDMQWAPVALVAPFAFCSLPYADLKEAVSDACG